MTDSTPLLANGGGGGERRRTGSGAGSVVPPGEHHAGFGEKKSIGFFSSMCLLANNITGPGMVQIPSMFQAAGWVFPTIMFVYIGVLMGVLSTYLSKAVSMLPGNRNFEKRVEFNELAKLVFPRWLYILTMVALIFNFQVSNISSIVVSAQTMDNTLLEVTGKTCALNVYPASAPSCLSDNANATDTVTDSPFGSTYVISLGYIVTLVLIVPLGLINLEDNMWVQQGGFVLLVGCMVAWTVQFFAYGLSSDNMPASNAAAGVGPVLSTVVFNFGFLSTVPSWLNEKSPSVSVAAASWMSVIVSGIMFLVLGLLGGWGLNVATSSGDLLSAIVSDPGTTPVHIAAKVACYVFPSAALLSGIPVFSIIVRYNLLNEGVPRLWANLFGVVFPWVVALFFYAGSLLNHLITWSSAILFVLLNCLLPILIYIIRVREVELERQQAGRGALLDGETGGDAVHAGVGTINDAPLLDAAAKGGHRKSLEITAPPHLHHIDADGIFATAAGGGTVPVEADPNDNSGNPDIKELPPGLRCCSSKTGAYILTGMSVVLFLATLGLQIQSVADPEAA